MSQALTHPLEVDEGHLELYIHDKDLPTIKLLDALLRMTQQTQVNLNAYAEVLAMNADGEEDPDWMSRLVEEEKTLVAFTAFVSEVKDRWPDLPQRTRLTFAEQIRTWAVYVFQCF